MNSEYNADLRLLKKTFNPGNESAVVANAITSYASVRHLRILDVGIGEGHAAFQLVHLLSDKGFSVHMTGVDRYVSPEARAKAGANIDLWEGDFSSFPTNDGYDAVVATQSLYYLGDTEMALKRLLELTKGCGALIITTWTERCILQKLHNLFSKSTESQTIHTEYIADFLHKLVQNASIRVVRTTGMVDISRWLASEDICQAAFRILSRSEVPRPLGTSGYDAFRSFLVGLPQKVYRENGTLILSPKKRE